MKYRFKIVYQTKNLKKICDFMKKCDLDIGILCFEEIYMFDGKDDISISLIKETFKKGFHLCDCQIIHIEGGKVE